MSYRPNCAEKDKLIREQRDEIARLLQDPMNVGWERAQSAIKDRAAAVTQWKAAKLRAERAEAERDAAMKVIEAAKAMREAGVDLSRRCIEPPYMSEKAAVNEMIGIFDGPLQRSFDAALAAFEKEQGR